MMYYVYVSLNIFIIHGKKMMATDAKKKYTIL